MKRKFMALVAAGVMAISMAACDDDGSVSANSGTNSGNNDGGTLTPEQLADGYIELMCEKSLSCCTDGLDLGSGSAVTTKEDCVSSAAMQGLRSEILEDLNDPKVHYNPTAASACLAQIKIAVNESQCDKGLTMENPEKEIGECTATIQGTVEEGGACTKDVQCQGNMHCVGSTCIVPKDPGEACTVDDECISYSCNNGSCAESGDDSIDYEPWTGMCYDPNAMD